MLHIGACTVVVVGHLIAAAPQSDLGEMAAKVSIQLPVTVGLREPVIATLTIENLTERALSVDLGTNHKSGWQFWIKAPEDDGAVVRYTPYNEFGDPGDVTLAGHGRWTQELLLNEWYEFRTPGSYEVRVSIGAPVMNSEKRRIKVDPAVTHMRVRERDAEGLRVLCNTLASSALAGGFTALALESARRLAVVHDEACLSAVTDVLGSSRHFDSVMIGALEKIGGARAVAVLRSLVSEGGDRAALAADSLTRVRPR